LSRPEQCLTEFCSWYDDRKTDVTAKEKYEFTVSIAPAAISEYMCWEGHEAWNGHRIWESTKKGGRVCGRDASGKIEWVSPGLVFPIMSAMSEFVVETSSGKWQVRKPKIFRPREMIANAVTQFRRAAFSDPMAMGRNAGIYDALRMYPNALMQVISDYEESKRK